MEVGSEVLTPAYNIVFPIDTGFDRGTFMQGEEVKIGVCPPTSLKGVDIDANAIATTTMQIV